MSNYIYKRLKKLRVIDTLIKSKRMEIAELKSSTMKGQSFSDKPKSSSQDNSTENLNIRIIDKIEEIHKEITTLYNERDELTKAIDSLDDPIQQTVIRLYYVNGYSWKEIATELNGKQRTFQNIRNEAVKELDKIIPKNTKISQIT